MGRTPDDLPADKRERVVRAALEEFAERGYEMASTNVITARAGISKGLLFHYFGSKKNLFLYLVRHAAGVYIQRFNDSRLELHPDVVERLFQIGQLKQKLLADDPVMAKFYAGAFLEPPAEVKDELAEIERGLSGLSARILTDGLDLSRLRLGLEPKQALTFITACLDGLRNLYRSRVDPAMVDRPEEVGAIIAEMRQYLDMLKSGVYEQPHLLRASGRALIIEDGRILLSEFDDATGLHYNLPGGGVEPGETVREALIREVREETCLEVEVGRMLFALEYEPERNRGWAGPTHHISLVFECRARPGSEARLPDHPDPNQTGVKWLPLADPSTVELLPHLAPQLRAYAETGVFDPAYLEERVDPTAAKRCLE